MNIATTYDLLKPIIDSIDRTFRIESIVDNSDGTYAIASCNTLWVTKGDTITLNTIDYKVVEIEQDEWIKIKGTVLPTATEFLVDEIHFFNNTVLAQNELMGEKSDYVTKYPLIWLHEVTPNDNYPSSLSAIDRIVDCDIYFLSPRNNADWLRQEDEKYVVKPMRKLMGMFVDILFDTPAIYSEKLRFKSYDHANFGDYQPAKGYPDNIFNENTSGTQFAGQIQFYKTGECACC